MSDEADRYRVVWPQSPRQSAGARLAARPETLDGKRIAFVWDNLFHGDRMFGWLEAVIKARFPKAEFVHWKEFGNTHGPNEREVVAALPQRLRELRVDCAISGVGA